MKNTSFKSMLVTISLLGVVPVAVNTFMDQSVVPYAKTSLEDVITERTVKGEDAPDAESVLAQVVLLNPEITITDVEVGYFTKATEISSGSATILAKSESEFIGSVGITIDRLPKINLNTVITATVVKGQNAFDPDKLLKEIGLINPRLTKEDVEIQDFIEATPISNGSAKVVAKDGTKYTGEVNITITAAPKIDINDVIRIREVNGENALNEDALLIEVARLNEDLDINDVEVGDFREASESAPGAATIVAKDDTKYVGEVAIVINKIPKTLLSSIITERTVDGTVANTVEQVLTEIANLNPELDVASVEVVYFTKATDITSGSAIISATVNGRYSGQVGITITQLSDVYANEAHDEEDVVNAINSTKFSKSVNLNSEVAKVKASFTAKYVKDRLSEEIDDIFDDNLFTLNEIYHQNGDDFSDADLMSKGRIDLVGLYDYGSIVDQKIELVVIVKNIERSEERKSLLNLIKAKADKDEDDNVWSQAWFDYFKQIEADLKTFSFEFPVEALNDSQINTLQNIIYDEIKFVMESDLNWWGIEKGYDPTSVAVQYNNFSVNQESKEFLANGRVSIDIRTYGSYVKHSVRFSYTSFYNVI